MKTTKVSDLMIPAKDFPSVSHEATLREALVILEEAERNFKETRALPRAVLVFDDENQIIGKISYWDVLRALEPKYKSMGDASVLCRCGWSPNFIKSMLRNYDLLKRPLVDACSKAASVRVCDVMTPLREDELLHQEQEIVDHDGSLDEVIHLLVMGNLMALYVRKEKRIVGIVRLSDVFLTIAEAVKRRK
jgi:CBS domain-containing protein